jgi:LCP family protein required for cell wall assembly
VARVDPLTRRRRIRRLLITLNVLLAATALLVGTGVAYLSYQKSQIDTVKELKPVTEGGPMALVPKGDPVNILVVGSDSRAAAKEAKDKKQFGTGVKVDGQRSDTMMVVRLDPKNDKATILSIPRDMYVDLEGGGKGRLNQAFASVKDANKADPDRLIRTIINNFGIPITHYVEIDFFGFREAVNAVGGVKVWFEFPAKDDYSQLNIPTAGCVKLDGDQALAYVRSRHFDYLQNGRWRTDETSDFGRIKRQQDFIRRLVRKALAEGLTSPLTAHRLINAAVKNLSVDPGFDPGDMRTLASQLRNVNEGGLVFLSIPGIPVKIGGADVLQLDKQGANEVLAAFGAPRLTTTTTRAAASSATTAVPAGAVTPPTTQPAPGSDPTKLC